MEFWIVYKITRDDLTNEIMIKTPVDIKNTYFEAVDVIEGLSAPELFVSYTIEKRNYDKDVIAKAIRGLLS